MSQYLVQGKSEAKNRLPPLHHPLLPTVQHMLLELFPAFLPLHVDKLTFHNLKSLVDENYFAPYFIYVKCTLYIIYVYIHICILHMLETKVTAR